MEALKQLFEQWAGVPCDECLMLSGGGSSRRYYRMSGSGRPTLIGCIATDKRENEAFFSYTRQLHAKGMPVPELYAVSDDGCRYLQQDLGDQTIYGILFEKKRHGSGFDAEMLGLYRQALADLDALQKAGRDMDFSKAYPRAAFDRRSMLWDLNYFKYFYLKLAHIQFDEELLEDDFQRLVDFLLEADCSYFLYRDFQGRNIMVSETGNGASHPALYYIDYQGGRRGAAQYDVASLLYSAKSDLPEVIRRELLQYYVDLHGDKQFMHYFWGYVLLRIMQTLGAYGYRGYYERKPYFLESIPLAISNLHHISQEHPLPVSLPELERIWNSLNANAATNVGDGLGEMPLTVKVSSFSFKQGLPEDDSGNGGGHIFDCRALPNPGRYPEYKCYTGKDAPVVEFLEREPAVALFLDHSKAIVAQSVDKYLERHFSHLCVSFGCTGGQHRSVYCAEEMVRWLRETYPQIVVEVCHREQDRQ